jgi:hypothetical protein
MIAVTAGLAAADRVLAVSNTLVRWRLFGVGFMVIGKILSRGSVVTKEAPGVSNRAPRFLFRLLGQGLLCPVILKIKVIDKVGFGA